MNVAAKNALVGYFVAGKKMVCAGPPIGSRPVSGWEKKEAGSGVLTENPTRLRGIPRFWTSPGRSSSQNPPSRDCIVRYR